MRRKKPLRWCQSLSGHRFANHEQLNEGPVSVSLELLVLALQLTAGLPATIGAVAMNKRKQWVEPRAPATNERHRQCRQSVRDACQYPCCRTEYVSLSHLRRANISGPTNC